MFDKIRERLGRKPRAKKTRVLDSSLFALACNGQAVWSGRDYHAFAREGYASNPIAFRAVRMIAEAAASVPLLLYDRAQEITDHPLLALLARPNGFTDGATLLEAWYSHLLIAGNAYLEAAIVGAEAKALYVLRPDRMRVVTNARGWPAAYQYTVGADTISYDQSGALPPILHVSLFHPLNDHYGMSALEAAMRAIDIHNASSAWTKSLLDNAARPSGALVYRGEGLGHLPQEQFERLKRELEDSFSGAINAGRPMLLEGGLDWKAISLTPQDMDFLNAKNTAAREIALALGVPPMLLGIPGDNTYANYKEANVSFWRQTVVPLVQKTARALSGWLAAPQSAALHLEPDLDAVPALSAERDALWARVSAADFLTDAEKREAVGYSASSSRALRGAKYCAADTGSADPGSAKQHSVLHRVRDDRREGVA
jgi:HK97 family phage portal protein